MGNALREHPDRRRIFPDRRREHPEPRRVLENCYRQVAESLKEPPECLGAFAEAVREPTAGGGKHVRGTNAAAHDRRKPPASQGKTPVAGGECPSVAGELPMEEWPFAALARQIPAGGGEVPAGAAAPRQAGRQRGGPADDGIIARDEAEKGTGEDNNNFRKPDLPRSVHQ